MSKSKGRTVGRSLMLFTYHHVFLHSVFWSEQRSLKASYSGKSLMIQALSCFRRRQDRVPSKYIFQAFSPKSQARAMALCACGLDFSFLLIKWRSFALEIGKRPCRYRGDEGTDDGDDFIGTESTSQPMTAYHLWKNLLGLRHTG